MNQATSQPTPSMDNARQLVGAVVTILEKLHSEGFLAMGVFQNLGLSKVKATLAQAPDAAQFQELNAFVQHIDALFAAQQLLHPSATPKFQALFRGYLQAALQACVAAPEADHSRPAGTTLH